MSQQVIFEDENDNGMLMQKRGSFGDPDASRSVIVNFFIERKIVKNSNQANVMLVIFSILLLAASVYLYSSLNTKNDEVTLKNGTRITVEQYADGLRKGLYK